MPVTPNLATDSVQFFSKFNASHHKLIDIKKKEAINSKNKEVETIGAIYVTYNNAMQVLVKHFICRRFGLFGRRTHEEDK